MGLENDIENKVKEYLGEGYTIEETNGIPTVDNLYHGKRLKKINLSTLSIDFRKSSELLFKQNQEISTKIHKSFLSVVVDVILRMGGKIRSFQGDSILSFFPAETQAEIQNTVKSAMYINWFLTQKLNTYFKEYFKIDFGIGIDWGSVYISRAGVTNQAVNNDLIYIGKCVNLAVKIANTLGGNNNIGITERVYTNLDESTIFSKKNNEKRNMWKESSIDWSEQNWKIRTTSYYWNLEL